MRITVFGGDARFAVCSLKLKDAGHDVSVYAIDRKHLKHYGAEGLKADEYTKCDTLVLPLPFTTDGIYINCPLTDIKYKISDVFGNINSNAKVLCGKITTLQKRTADEYGLKLTDYYESEHLQIKNADLSAEAAVSVFMSAESIAVNNSECAVVGYGRIGKRLSEKLIKLGSNVTVAARNINDLYWAEMSGCKTSELESFTADPKYCDCIFNTVPYNIFDEVFIEKLHPDTLFIDLASKPYGMSGAASKKLEDRYMIASSLPGKYAPETAGKIIAETICEYL